MNNKRIANTAVTAGEIMLRGGAEAYRVEDTICRILRTSGYEKAEAFVTATGIVATLDDDSIDAITIVKRVDHRVTNLNHIYLVNNISRQLCDGTITTEEAMESLINIKEQKQYKDRTVWFFTVFVSIFFSILLGGAALDMVVTAINGILLSSILYGAKRMNVNAFITNMSASFIIAISTTFWNSIFHQPLNTEVIITSSIMVMVPGVAITNAIRDTLQGDYMSGGARALEAFMWAASIAVGIGSGLGFSIFLKGGLF